jgi:hypothetical protein
MQPFSITIPQCIVTIFYSMEHCTYLLLARSGDKHCGRWRYDESNQCWIGNPVHSAEVEDMLAVCKNKDGEAERTHSKAMSIQDMERLYEFSVHNCPKVDDLGSKNFVASRGSTSILQCISEHWIHHLDKVIFFSFHFYNDC